MQALPRLPEPNAPLLVPFMPKPEAYDDYEEEDPDQDPIDVE